MTWAMLVEIYRDYGIKFEEAMTELKKTILGPDSPEHARATEANEARSMAMLKSMMSGSNFGGPKG